MKKLLFIIAAVTTFSAEAQHLPEFSTNTIFQKQAGSFNPDILKEWHNEFLDHILYGVQEMQLCLKSGSFYKGVNAISKQFFQDKGIILSGEMLLNNEIEPYIKEVVSFDFCKQNIGREASIIICRLDRLIKDYSNNFFEVAELEARLEELINQAEVIENELEKIAVKSSLTIAGGSARYWEAMAFKYRQWLSAICTMEIAGRAAISGFANPSYHHFSYAAYSGVYSEKNHLSPPDRGIIGRMVVSDAVGAFQGAIFGGLGGGPIGAFAGAILGAGARSVMRGLFYGFTGW